MTTAQVCPYRKTENSPIWYIKTHIARKTDTFKWLEKFKAKWRLKSKESELCEIEKLFLGMEAISNKQKKPEYESS